MQCAKGAEREALASSLRKYVRVDSIAMNFVLESLRHRLAETGGTRVSLPLIAA